VVIISLMGGASRSIALRLALMAGDMAPARRRDALTIVALAASPIGSSGWASRRRSCSGRPRADRSVLASDIQVGPPQKGRRTRHASPDLGKRPQRRAGVPLRAARITLASSTDGGLLAGSATPSCGRSAPRGDRGGARLRPRLARVPHAERAKLSRTGDGFVASA
jgi:hypothetical protein